MRKEYKTGPYIYPMPVLMVATYDEDGSVDVMNAAWGCAIDYDMIAVCMSEHQTTRNIERNKSFTVSLASVETIKEADYFGIVSHKDDPHKFAKTGFHSEKAKTVNAPIILEFPLAMECEFERVDEESGMYYGRIKKVTVDEKILDENGKIDLSKAGVVMFDMTSRHYFGLGEVVADAYKAGLVYKK